MKEGVGFLVVVLLLAFWFFYPVCWFGILCLARFLILVCMDFLSSLTIFSCFSEVGGGEKLATGFSSGIWHSYFAATAVVVGIPAWDEGCWLLNPS